MPGQQIARDLSLCTMYIMYITYMLRIVCITDSIQSYYRVCYELCSFIVWIVSLFIWIIGRIVRWVSSTITLLGYEGTIDEGSHPSERI